jgi:uncharacterized delta-60 repeat protein
VKRSATLFGLTLLALGPLGVSSAASIPLAGSLDPSFGSGGVVTQTRGFIGATAVEPDGKIVAAGDSAGSAFVARYLPNGSPDPSFGTGGYAVNNLHPPTKFVDAAAVAVQPDGKIVVAGTSSPLSAKIGPEFILLRYDASGSLDTSFGTDGITITAVPEPGHQDSDAAPAALAILPNGDILAAGSAAWSDGATFSSSFALARYTPTGSLDQAFGNAGIEQTAFRGANAHLAGIALQPDGKIVAAGWGTGSGPGDGLNTMLLARYEPNGSPDSTFGAAGKATTAPMLDYQGGPPALQNGKIVVAGDDDMEFPVLARYGKSGRLDTTFGDHGFVTIAGPLVAPTPPAVLVGSDGAILVGLPGADAETGADAVVRLTPDGRLDPSFGATGVALLPSSGSTSLDLQTDGKVLAGGGTSGSMLVRLLGGNNCTVPALRGMTLSRARAALKTSYCGVGGISKRFSKVVARGRVISTRPLLLGGRLPGGTRVALVVSKGGRT